MTNQNENKQDSQCDDKATVAENLTTGDNAVIDSKKKNKALEGMKENVDDYAPINSRVVLD